VTDVIDHKLYPITEAEARMLNLRLTTAASRIARTTGHKEEDICAVMRSVVDEGMDLHLFVSCMEHMANMRTEQVARLLIQSGGVFRDAGRIARVSFTACPCAGRTDYPGEASVPG
jgi:hypothetical protein